MGTLADRLELWLSTGAQCLSVCVCVVCDCILLFLNAALALCKYSLAEWNVTEELANRTVSHCHYHGNANNCTGKYGEEVPSWCHKRLLCLSMKPSEHRPHTIKQKSKRKPSKAHNGFLSHMAAGSDFWHLKHLSPGGRCSFSSSCSKHFPAKGL